MLAVPIPESFIAAIMSPSGLLEETLVLALREMASDGLSEWSDNGKHSSNQFDPRHVLVTTQSSPYWSSGRSRGNLTARAVSGRLPTKLNSEFPEVVIKVPEPLERSDNRLVNKVHERLREMIASGEVPPETRLFQERLAASIGVSRTPLREALLRLEYEGFVYTVPGRGMFVRSLKPDQVSDMYQLREVLEPLAARLACESATDEQVAKIRDIQEQHEGQYPVEMVMAFRGNFDLHTSLVEPCPNRRMYQFLRDIWDQNSALLIFGYYTHHVGAVSSMVAEHREIVDAFVLRDSFTVERLLRQHIQEASELLIKSLNGLEKTGREI